MVYCGGTCSFQIYKSGINVSLVGVEVDFYCLYRADEFVQELFGGLGFSLVAEERLVVGVDRFGLVGNCGDQFHQAISNYRMFAS